jgi:monothiol glutaredoxin
MTTSPTVALIEKQLADNPVILYMKGTADHPECGYSGAAVAALKKAGIAFNYVNILQAPLIRERLPSISQWPTFPQLFINGELVGGSDIVCAAVADGSLQAMLPKALNP